LREAEADAFLDRLRAEFAAGHLEDQKARLEFIQRELADVRHSQRISPRWIGAIISGIASNLLYDVLKSGLESGPADTTKPTTSPSLRSEDPDSYKVHILIVNVRDHIPIKDARIELDHGIVDSYNLITRIVNGGVHLTIETTRFPVTFHSGEDGTAAFAINNVTVGDPGRWVVSASALGFLSAHRTLRYKSPKKYRQGAIIVEIFTEITQHFIFDESIVIELSPRTWYHRPTHRGQAS